MVGDGRAVETGRLPGAAPGFYEPAPGRQEASKTCTWTPAPSLRGPPMPLFPPRAAHQPATLATQAGILEPGPHVLVRADHEGAHHQDFLPVLHDPLAALKRSEVTVSSVLNPPPRVAKPTLE